MERETVFDVPVHYTMAIFGGFIGAYAILARMQVFGSAQTANMIELVCGILGRDPERSSDPDWRSCDLYRGDRPFSSACKKCTLECEISRCAL